MNTDANLNLDRRGSCLDFQNLEVGQERGTCKGGMCAGILVSDNSYFVTDYCDSSYGIDLLYETYCHPDDGGCSVSDGYICPVCHAGFEIAQIDANEQGQNIQSPASPYLASRICDTKTQEGSRIPR